MVKMFQKLVAGGRMRVWPLTKNGDMWQDIEQVVRSRPSGAILVNKIKAHIAEHKVNHQKSGHTDWETMQRTDLQKKPMVQGGGTT